MLIHSLGLGPKVKHSDQVTGLSSNSTVQVYAIGYIGRGPTGRREGNGRGERIQTSGRTAAFLVVQVQRALRQARRMIRSIHIAADKP